MSLTKRQQENDKVCHYCYKVFYKKFNQNCHVTKAHSSEVAVSLPFVLPDTRTCREDGPSTATDNDQSIAEIHDTHNVLPPDEAELMQTTTMIQR